MDFYFYKVFNLNFTIGDYLFYIFFLIILFVRIFLNILLPEAHDQTGYD